MYQIEKSPKPKMFSQKTIFILWLGWAAIMLAYQVWVPARLQLRRPDYALAWTPTETTAGSQNGKIYLNEALLNRHVSWDSEYYLAIAVGGYEDPNIQRIGDSVVSGGGGFWPFVIPSGGAMALPGISLNYAFFPFYPLMIRLLAWPLSLTNLSPIAAATVSGVVVSMLGTLAAMLALFELGRAELGDEGGLRATFYLIIFPAGFFLAQIYTEGLFLGLAFSSLLLLRRGRRGWAILLAVLATFTRAVGVALVVPLLLNWAQEKSWLDLDLDWRQLYFNGLPWAALGQALLIFLPFLAFEIWRFSYYGMAFSRVEADYFGRGLLSLGYTFVAWSEAFKAFFGPNPQAAAYYAVEFGAIILGFWACLSGRHRHPDLAWFGFLVVFLSFTTGPAQGMHRYIMAAPPVFLFLSRLGQRPAFDRAWTLASTLIMGIMATLFMFDMWAG